MAPSLPPDSFTEGLIYIPEPPRRKPRRKRRSRPAPTPIPKAQHSNEASPQDESQEKSEKKFTLAEAFDYDPADYVGDPVKGTLAVAYLLESVSEFGNRPIPGGIAQGLAFVLRHYAKQTGTFLCPICASDQVKGHK